MIVVDTNVIAYLYLPVEQSALAEQLLAIDDHWIAPTLWRSEFRNILALYMRKEIPGLTKARDIQAAVESQMSENEYEPVSREILELAFENKCSAYDCEFVALARSMNIPLITADRKLVKANPEYSCLLQDYVNSSS